MMFEKQEKYLVFKLEDMEGYLIHEDQAWLLRIAEQIEVGRERDGKPSNRYVVVNEDEDYADLVWLLIENGERRKASEVMNLETLPLMRCLLRCDNSDDAVCEGCPLFEDRVMELDAESSNGVVTGAWLRLSPCLMLNAIAKGVLHDPVRGVEEVQHSEQAEKQMSEGSDRELVGAMNTVIVAWMNGESKTFHIVEYHEFKDGALWLLEGDGELTMIPNVNEKVQDISWIPLEE